jgi:hypothetical protein
MKAGEIWSSSTYIWIVLDKIGTRVDILGNTNSEFLVFEQSRISFDWGTVKKKINIPVDAELTSVENSRYVKMSTGTKDLFRVIIDNCFKHG